MRDIAAEKTDRLLSKLENKIHDEYTKAFDDADKRWREYLSAFEKQDKIEAKRLADCEITKQQYQEWRQRHLAQGKQWEEMRDVIAKDLHNSNLIAARLANGSMADIYALNANYGTYLVEKSGKISTGFTLYNHDSAEALLKEEWKINPQTGRNSFLPKPSAKKQKELKKLKSTNPDVLWNARNIQSAMFQSILIGESIPDIAKRLASVAVMDEHQAIRNARTLTTNVQNKGRMDAFDRASKLGVELVDEWNSILDGRTRHSHRHMHGERRPHDSKKPFSNGCMYPGDPHAPAAEVYNCRCRLISWVKGFEGETVKYNEAIGNMSFDEWLDANSPKKDLTSSAKNAFINMKGLPAEFKKNAGEILSKCQHDEAKEVYLKYGDQLVCVDSNYSNTAAFSSTKKGFYFDANQVEKGDDLHNPYETFFHEAGHMIDWIASDRNSTLYLSNFEDENGKDLLSVLKSDFEFFKKSMNVRTDSGLIKKLKGERMRLSTRGNISDVIEGITKISYPLGVGHGAEYHNQFKTEREFFAEVLDSAVTNEEAYIQMKRIFPNGVDFVWKALKEAINE